MLLFCKRQTLVTIFLQKCKYIFISTKILDIVLLKMQPTILQMYCELHCQLRRACYTVWDKMISYLCITLVKIQNAALQKKKA
jgi:hypothetical protein